MIGPRASAARHQETQERTLSTPNTDQQRRNKRTALIIGSIALVFFAGIIVRRWLVINGIM
ncbi:hypothetical protein IP84_08355 [beta proteobacterium AAP99]|nr:hypothetical protein IP84_08355 [beta proteobacterium AAP99]